MKSRASVLSAALSLLVACCHRAAAQQSPQDDGVARFVSGLRAPAVKREALFASAEDSLSNGHYREAEDTLQSLLARYPPTTRAIEDLARAYIGENRNEEALGFLQLPDSPQASNTLGWLYLKRQRTQMAIPLLRGLVNQALEVSTYRYHLAMALLQKGDTESGMGELQSALRCDPPADERERIQTLMNPTGARR